jgi:hypothetical protein
MLHSRPLNSSHFVSSWNKQISPGTLNTEATAVVHLFKLCFYVFMNISTAFDQKYNFTGQLRVAHVWSFRCISRSRYKTKTRKFATSSTGTDFPVSVYAKTQRSKVSEWCVAVPWKFDPKRKFKLIVSTALYDNSGCTESDLLIFCLIPCLLMRRVIRFLEFHSRISCKASG